MSRPSRRWLKSRCTVMLLASLRVAASKCCHALAMPAGGQEEAAGHEVLEQIENLPRADYNPRADRPRRIASCHADPLRFAHHRDQERADTWHSSGMYRFSSLGKSLVRTGQPSASRISIPRLAERLRNISSKEIVLRDNNGSADFIHFSRLSNISPVSLPACNDTRVDK